MFPSSVESQGEQVGVRPSQAAQPISGSGSSREDEAAQMHSSQANEAQDAVKVQIEPPGEIAVYRFLNQYGNLILQVPPQQWLNLAQDIAKELADEAVPKQATGAGKGESHGY
jgi:hypothetical protein